MSIPDYRGLMQPTLQALAEAGSDTGFEPLMDRLARGLGLTSDIAAERLPSGKETVLSNRLQWALAYLQSTGMVVETGGAYRSTEAGCDRATADRSSAPKPDPTPAAASASPAVSPHGLLEATFGALHDRLRHEVLARIHEQRPQFFEHLVIDLLLALGYGRHRRELARCLGRRGDGGIDGAVRQDALGLDVVYVQAKRYRPGSLVPASAVRDFAGSLEAAKAGKGVFVTTACFPRSAEEFVTAVPSRIALIDGHGLAGLLLHHNIAVRARESFEIKEVDESYFASWRHLPEVSGYPSKAPAHGRRLS